MSDPALIAGLNVLADNDRIAHEKLDTILEAITRDPEPSTIGPLLEQLVHAVNESTAETRRGNDVLYWIKANMQAHASGSGKGNGHGV